MPDTIMKEHSNAYMQLATLQTKLDEDDYIISMLQANTCGDSSRCDTYNLALEIIAARRKELNRELRKVKKRICEIESVWRG